MKINSITQKPPPKDYSEIINRVSNFCCDECSLPLKNYGANYYETYTNGRVNVLRTLCDIHALELEDDLNDKR